MNEKVLIEQKKENNLARKYLLLSLVMNLFLLNIKEKFYVSPCAKTVRQNKCTIAKCQGSEVKIKLHKFELHKSHRLGG